MSYCRWGEDGSEVYIYPTGYYDKDLRRNVDRIVCMDCLLNPEEDGHRADFTAKDPVEMLAHVKTHLATGHKVGPRAVERLKQEVSEP